MTPSAPIDRSTPAPSHEFRPFGAINKKLRVSPRIVARFVAGSLLSLKSHAGPRGTPDLAAALQQSCIAWKKNMLHVEDLRTHLGQLPSSPSLSPSPSTSSTAYHGDQERPALPHALLVYDEASASARADYANFLQASRGFSQNYVDAVLERMRFQNGALEVLVTLLEMARSLREEAAQLKVSFRKGPCKQFKHIIKEFNSKPMLFDSDIFKDVDLSLRDIQTAYQLLDGFWVTEMHHLGQAIDTVHVDRARVERWLGYKDAFEEAISKWRSVGALTNDGIEDVEVDLMPETAAVSDSDLTAIAKQLCPHMTTAGSLLHTIRDNVSSADMAPIQVAIFGLQQSQQECLSFFSECVKYWEKLDMRSEASAPCPTVEKLATSQKLLMEKLNQAPNKAQLAIHSFQNAIRHDGHSDNARDRRALSRAATDTRLHFGLDHGGIGDIMSRLRSLEEPGYDPFRGMSLEELGKEREKWTACRKFFEKELRANHGRLAE